MPKNNDGKYGVMCYYFLYFIISRKTFFYIFVNLYFMEIIPTFEFKIKSFRSETVLY